MMLAGSRDELEADFQQFYGLDLDRMGQDYSVAHAGVLASQLPREARVLKKIDPDFEWSDEMGILVRIDYLLQSVIYALSGGKGGSKPEPIPTPSERRNITNKLEDAEREMDEIAQILGIGDRDGDNC